MDQKQADNRGSLLLRNRQRPGVEAAAKGTWLGREGTKENGLEHDSVH